MNLICLILFGVFCLASVIVPPSRFRLRENGVRLEADITLPLVFLAGMCLILSLVIPW